jgi:uncharacterized membrane protein
VPVQIIAEGSGQTLAEGQVTPQPNPQDPSRAEGDLVLHVAVGTDPLVCRVRLPPRAGEFTPLDNTATFTFTPRQPKLRVLYLEGTQAFDEPGAAGWWQPDILAEALERSGRIEVEIAVPAHQYARNQQISRVPRGLAGRRRSIQNTGPGYPLTRAELYRYDVVICSDITRYAFSEEQLQWTVDLVAERGGGFVMIGGMTSFGAGYWDQTIWEKLLPVDMDPRQRGTLGGMTFLPHVPAAARSHPIFQNMLAPGEELAAVMERHPPFYGTNLVGRAKPAATILATMDPGEMPIWVVQPFGKGRTMAFTPDCTYQWGMLHHTRWGPRDAPPRPAPGGAEPLANDHFARFWTSAIHWLAAQSANHRVLSFRGRTASLLAWPGETVDLSAAFQPAVDDLSGWQVEAQWHTVPPPPSVALLPDPASRRFTGRLTVPPLLSPGAHDVRFTARSADGRQVLTDDVTLAIPDLNPELFPTVPDSAGLAALARTSGGPVLTTAAEAAAWVEQRVAQPPAPPRRLAHPAWARSGPLLCLLALLLGEWLLRRVGPRKESIA